MKEIFEKATTQHHFIGMYSDLCFRMNDWLAEQKHLTDDDKAFNRILLNECQTSFERNLRPPDGLGGCEPDEKLEKMIKYKTAMLGNMKLVGQLLINKMLSSKIIFTCTKELLALKSDETLETLCVFLKSIGPTFDFPTWGRHAEFLKTMERVKDLVHDKSVSQRIRFLLKDLVELQASGWESKNKAEGPTTLAAVQRQWKADNVKSDAGRSLKGAFSAVNVGLNVPPPSIHRVDSWTTMDKGRRVKE